jgi:hypothetical protein
MRWNSLCSSRAEASTSFVNHAVFMILISIIITNNKLAARRQKKGSCCLESPVDRLLTLYGTNFEQMVRYSLLQQG